MKVKVKAILIFGFIGSLFLFAHIRSHIYEKELKKNGKTTIGRIDSMQRLPKWSIIYLSYYVNNKKHVFHENDLDAEISRKDINKFYRVKYLSTSPEIIRVSYLREITDTTSILKAGFSREEIGIK